MSLESNRPHSGLQEQTPHALRFACGEGGSVEAAEETAAPSAEPVPTLVLGSGITALGVLRTLGRRGFEVYAQSNPGDLAIHSRWFRPLPGVEPGSVEPADLARALARLSFERAVVIPCSDGWTAAASALPKEVARRFLTSLAPADAIRTLLDKGLLAQLLVRIDVPAPRTVLVESEADLAGLDDSAFHDVFLKPRHSQAFLERFHVKAFRVNGRTDAMARLREISAAGLPVVLQEYVPGPPSSHYFLDGFVDRSGRVRARFARRRLRMFPPDFGNSTLTVSIPFHEVAPAIDALDLVLDAVRFRGIFSAEFKRDARDGVLRLLEVNVRPWWYLGFAESCGVPVCELYQRDALGLPPPVVRPYVVGRRCAYPYFDFAAYRFAKQSGATPRPRLAGVLRSWWGADQPIFAWDDVRPAAFHFGFLTRRFVRTHLRRARR